MDSLCDTPDLLYRKFKLEYPCTASDFMEHRV